MAHGRRRRARHAPQACRWRSPSADGDEPRPRHAHVRFKPPRSLCVESNGLAARHSRISPGRERAARIRSARRRWALEDFRVRAKADPAGCFFALPASCLADFCSMRTRAEHVLVGFLRARAARGCSTQRCDSRLSIFSSTSAMCYQENHHQDPRARTTTASATAPQPRVSAGVSTGEARRPRLVLRDLLPHEPPNGARYDWSNSARSFASILPSAYAIDAGDADATAGCPPRHARAALLAVRREVMWAQRVRIRRRAESVAAGDGATRQRLRDEGNRARVGHRLAMSVVDVEVALEAIMAIRS